MPLTMGSSDSTHCRGLDSDRSLFTGIAIIGTSLSGTGGLTSIAIDDKNVKLGLSIGSIVLAAGTALFTKLAGDSASAWVRDCTQ
jgi:hypothetical protein